MKAISLWQPWASLWMSPSKIHETRHWATPHRGPLLVHAAKKFVKDVDEQLDDILTGEFGGHWGMELPTGALLGYVYIDAVLPTNVVYDGRACRDPASLSEDEAIDVACGDFSEGRFAWHRTPIVRLFAEPIPYRGRQSIFDVPDDLINRNFTASQAAVL